MTPTGYIDLQVNGYGGVDFNDDDLTLEGLHRACEHLRSDGVEQILTTIITEQVPTMCRRLRRIVELREQDALVCSVVAGIHIEGPFISAVQGFRGAHPLDAIRPADTDAMRQLLDAAGGLTRLVTLAPECDPDFKVTRLLAHDGVIISAGHSDASLDQLKGAIDAGLRMYTHLGNGCPMQMPRHDNIIQRVLSVAPRLRISFIADGVHIPMFVLGNYLQCVGIERAIVVTDAIAAAGLGSGRYRFARWDLQIGDDLAARAPDGSHLVGSAITMRQSKQNLHHGLGLSEEDCNRLLTTNAASLLTANKR